jgi:hypothetical protein
VREHLTELWKMLKSLRRGAKPSNGNLTSVIGYGERVFALHGLSKKTPRDLRRNQFLPPSESRPILTGSGIKYTDRPKNVGTDEHIVLQIISESQLATFRAVEQTWLNIS